MKRIESKKDKEERQEFFLKSESKKIKCKLKKIETGKERYWKYERSRRQTKKTIRKRKREKKSTKE